MEAENSFHSGREGLKAREIEKRYPAEKAKKLMALLRARKLYYFDDDFPDDEDESFSQLFQTPKNILRLQDSIYITMSSICFSFYIGQTNGKLFKQSHPTKEIYYMCGKAKHADQINRATEGIALEGTLAPDQKTLDSLTEEGGPLHAGALPGADGLTPDAEKALWDAMGKETVKVKQVKPTKDPAVECVPKTVKEYLVSKMFS